MNSERTLGSRPRTTASLPAQTSGDTTTSLACTLSICATRPSAVSPRFTGTAIAPNDTAAR